MQGVWATPGPMTGRQKYIWLSYVYLVFAWVFDDAWFSIEHFPESYALAQVPCL